MTGPPELKMPARKSCGHFRLCRAVKMLPGCGLLLLVVGLDAAAEELDESGYA